MRAQDEAEFAELVTAVSHRLHRLAYAVCGDRGLAEDAVQSAWVSAYRTWPRVRDVDSPEAYVRRMVVNQLMSWRRRKSWTMTTQRSGRRAEPGLPRERGRRAPAGVVAVGELPPRQRAVIVLRYYEGMSEADIAETLGIRPGTVKSQASAAMARLRARWPRPSRRSFLLATTRRGRGEMELEDRVASAIRAQTDRLDPTTPDVAVIRASAKTQTRRRAAIVLGCAGPQSSRSSPRESPTSARTGPTASGRSPPRPQPDPVHGGLAP